MFEFQLEDSSPLSYIVQFSMTLSAGDLILVYFSVSANEEYRQLHFLIHLFLDSASM